MTYIKKLLDEVFVISGKNKVEVSVISRAKAEADNIYQDLDFQERNVHTFIRPYARAVGEYAYAVIK